MTYPSIGLPGCVMHPAGHILYVSEILAGLVSARISEL